jgi:L-fuconolactonase
MIIDAHVHFWRPALGHDILIVRREERLRRDYLPADLAPAMTAGGVARAVVIQSAPETRESEYQLALAADLDWVCGVVGWVDLAASDVGASLDRLQRRGRLLGVRAMLNRIDDPAWIAGDAPARGLAELARRGLSLDLIARPPHLEPCLRALSRVPGLRAVIDHGGTPPVAARGWEPWAERIAHLARETGVFCKFSGLFEEALPEDGADALLPYAAHLAECFGSGRLVFASNWPVCEIAGGHARWLATAQDLAKRLGLDARALFADNATRLYAPG